MSDEIAQNDQTCILLPSANPYHAKMKISQQFLVHETEQRIVVTVYNKIINFNFQNGDEFNFPLLSIKTHEIIETLKRDLVGLLNTNDRSKSVSNLDSFKMKNNDLSVKTESLKIGSVKNDSVRNDSLKSDSIKTNSFKSDNVGQKELSEQKLKSFSRLSLCGLYVIEVENKTFKLLHHLEDINKFDLVLTNTIYDKARMHYAVEIPRQFSEVNIYFTSLTNALFEATDLASIYNYYLCLVSFLSRTYTKQNIRDLNLNVAKKRLNKIEEAKSRILTYMLEAEKKAKENSGGTNLVQPQNNQREKDEVLFGLITQANLIYNSVQQLILKPTGGIQKQASISSYINVTYDKSNDEINKNYEFLGTLGSGAFATVYEGVEKATGDHYAIKKFDKSGLDKKHIDDIKAEVNIMKQIKHPNLIFCKGMYESSSEIHIIMELGPKGTLFDYISGAQVYNEQTACKIARAIIEAVDWLHQRKIVHRDLKPENILYETCPDDTFILKLTDFGFSRQVKTDGLQTSCGSPFYIAPEVLGNMNYDEKIDCWSIGVIIYILLSGCPPFYDRLQAKLFRKIRNGTYTYPSPTWDSVSSEAKDAIDHLLVVDSQKRASTSEILQHKWFNVQFETIANSTLLISENLNKFRKYIESKRRDFIMESELIKIKPGVLGTKSSKKFFTLTLGDLKIYDRKGGKLDRGFLLSNYKLTIDSISDSNEFTLNLTPNTGTSKHYQLKCTANEDKSKWELAVQRIYLFYELKSRAEKAFELKQFKSGLTLLSELRNIPEVTHTLDTVQFLRLLGLYHIDKMNCSFIWKWKTEQIHKLTISLIYYVAIGTFEYIFAGTKEGKLLLYCPSSNSVKILKLSQTDSLFSQTNMSEITSIYYQTLTSIIILGCLDGSSYFYKITPVEQNESDLKLSLISYQKSSSMPITLITGIERFFSPRFILAYADRCFEIYEYISSEKSHQIKKLCKQDVPASRPILGIVFWDTYMIVATGFTLMYTDLKKGRLNLEPMERKEKNISSGNITSMTLYRDKGLILLANNYLEIIILKFVKPDDIPNLDEYNGCYFQADQLFFLAYIVDFSENSILHESEIINIGYIKNKSPDVKDFIYSVDVEGRLIIWSYSEIYDGGYTFEVDSTRMLSNSGVVPQNHSFSKDYFRLFSSDGQFIDTWGLEWVLEYEGRRFYPPSSLLNEMN